VIDITPVALSTGRKNTLKKKVMKSSVRFSRAELGKSVHIMPLYKKHLCQMNHVSNNLLHFSVPVMRHERHEWDFLCKTPGQDEIPQAKSMRCRC